MKRTQILKTKAGYIVKIPDCLDTIKSLNAAIRRARNNIQNMTSGRACNLVQVGRYRESCGWYCWADEHSAAYRLSLRRKRAKSARAAAKTTL